MAKDLTETAVAINGSRRQQLRADEDYVHVMKYMGSKRELLPDIKRSIAKILPAGKTVLDLFSGSCSVGTYLRRDYNIYSNDVQVYSAVIADALISSRKSESVRTFEALSSTLQKEMKKNQKALANIFPKALERSDKFAEMSQDDWTEKKRVEYLKFLESYPSPLNEFKTSDPGLKKLRDLYFDKNSESENLSLNVNENFVAEVVSAPYLQTCFLFPETYFSLRQCADIDSIRYAVDKVCNSRYERSIALAALIHAHSYCSSGTGHFAMFRDLADVDSVKDVFTYRKRSVWAYFTKKLNELLTFRTFHPEEKHCSFSMGYDEILFDSKIMKSVDLIYADPPYSFVHYSRFYHATESLIKYDYMIPEFKGRYRTDRHQSPFCQGKNVHEAFASLFTRAVQYNKPVVLSYSDTGMISLEDIEKIVEDVGYKIEIEGLNYNHSTMGRKGHKSNLIKEYLVSAVV